MAGYFNKIGTYMPKAAAYMGSLFGRGRRLTTSLGKSFGRKNRSYLRKGMLGAGAAMALGGAGYGAYKGASAMSSGSPGRGLFGMGVGGSVAALGLGLAGSSGAMRYLGAKNMRNRMGIGRSPVGARGMANFFQSLGKFKR